MMKNLNDLKLSFKGHNNKKVEQQDFHTIVLGTDIEVIFKDLEGSLIEKISDADAVLGCVAWLTNYKILAELARLRFGASMVVQKEDFLRPDRMKNPKLRQTYDKIKAFNRMRTPGAIRELAPCSFSYSDPVRCVGNHNLAKSPAHPRMHHKFLVFLRVQERKPGDGEEDEWRSFKPYAAWTGSFNFTDNATKSFENAVYIENEEVAQAFANEHSQVLALSEELDWTTPWATPQYWIGS